MTTCQIMQQLTVRQALNILEILPDILFWIKDENCDFVYGNQLLVNHMNCKAVEQIIGKSDLDFFPAHIANQFMVDDKKVMTGDLVTERLELNMDNFGQIAWYSTTKRPLFDDHGSIIGSYGYTRHLQKTVKTLSAAEQLNTPVTYIHQHFHQEISIEKLAEITHISVSALERRFKKHLAKTPKQFIREVRLEHARKLLIETNLPIAEIAYQSGYTDHSYFSRHFKLMFNKLPSALRTLTRVAK
ncbi:helix-turn-helix domain-containing protein [Thalassotalea sp. PLHSN55]|uniref:PAS domain-containing protein n=1 Tax=Thalassotalea sp. PLHSN55 TaxID=3435888 RepID=UPI003F838E34